MDVSTMRPSSDGLEYSSFGSVIDLKAAGGGSAHLLTVVAGSGTVTVKTSRGNNRTFTMAAGDSLVMEIDAINSVSSITKVRVQWP